MQETGKDRGSIKNQWKERNNEWQGFPFKTCVSHENNAINDKWENKLIRRLIYILYLYIIYI